MMKQEAYTSKELATCLEITQQAVSWRAKNEGWKSRKRPGRGGGHEWLVKSMPEGTRAAIAAAELAGMEQTVQPVVLDLVIPDWAYERAKVKMRIVMEWRKYAAQAEKLGARIGIAINDFFTLLEAGEILPRKMLDSIGRYSIKSLYRWDKQLRESGDQLDALADKHGKWTKGGAKGLGQLGAEAEGIVLAGYLTPSRNSLAYVYERILKPRLENKGLPVPSYASVRRFVQRYEKDNYGIVMMRRYGEKAYDDKVGPYLSRNDKILKVGDVLVADGHRMNFMVINPETGKECRMTLIGWQDWASRMFVAFEIMLNENTQAISSSLHRAIVNLGKMPKCVYIDNGKAFKNKFFDGDVDLEDYDGLYMRLGIEPKHSAPYIARTKVIERWWKDFDQQCARALDSYIGASIAEKPAHLMRNEKWHKARRERLGQNYVPTVDDVVRIVTEFAKWKAMQPHPTDKDTTPWEMFEAGRGPGFDEAGLADMARHFMYRKQINPSRCRFTLYNIEYESEVLDVLHGIKKPLMAHYSYANLSEIYLYDEGRYLGRAHPVATVNPLAAKFGNEMDVQQIKGKLKEFTALRRDTRKLAAQVDEDNAQVLMDLPHMRPATERRLTLHVNESLPDKPKAIEAPAMSEAEAAELAEYSRQLQEAKKNAPAYKKPFFSTPAEKYEYLFDLMYFQHITLEADDKEFMHEFEAAERYDQLYARRYEPLRKLAEKQREKLA